MDSQEILTIELELDLAKARPAAAIGEEKIWSGITYIKTVTGWKPKGKMKEAKPEEVSLIHAPKLEKPAIPKEKQIENFAGKTKDSQLEAAIKDPKQEEEVKKIAQAELEKRKGELTEGLDKKKEEALVKVIKKTGIVVDGHKIFITMNEEGTGYVSKGHGIELKSEGEETLKDFKERLKEALTQKFSAKVEEPKVEEVEEPEEEVKEERSGDISEAEVKENTRQEAIKGTQEDRIAYMQNWYNADVPYIEEEKRNLLKTLQSIELGDYEKDIVKEARDIYKEFGVEKTLQKSMQLVSGDIAEAANVKANSLALQEFLIENNKEMICLPFMHQEYGDEEYVCYDYAGNEDDDFYYEDEDEDGSENGWVAQNYLDEQPDATGDEIKALGAYAGNSFYGFMTQYMYYKGDTSKLTEGAWKRAKIAGYETKESAIAAAQKYIKEINGYIDKNPISENMVLSRRIDPTKNSLIFDQITSLKKGDESSFESIQSFSYVQKAGFGNYQITLLAKKGDPIANARNPGEFEYVSKQNTKFKVLETGFNSMVIELIPEEKDLKKSVDVLKDTLILDFLKARPAAAIGEEKIWSGITYIKTVQGWKPKGKMKGSKQDETPKSLTPKLEEPSIPKEKQIENFAGKAKDSQLEAAIKDPKQDEEVKKIAQAELEKRKGELTEDLDNKKKELENKTELKKEEPVKETSSVEKDKEERTGDISEEEIKEEIRKEAIEGSVDDKKAYMADWYNKDVPYIEANKEELLKQLSSIELTSSDKDNYRKYKKRLNEKGFEIFSQSVMNNISGDSLYLEDLTGMVLAAQEYLIENNKEMICAPFMYQDHGGQSYECYDYIGRRQEDFESGGKIAEHYIEEKPKAALEEKFALSLYAGNSFYGFMTQYMYHKGDISKLTEEAWKRATMAGYETKEDAAESAKRYIELINNYIDKNPIQENVVLSRRINPTKNALIFDQITSLKKGDISSFESIQSFSYVQKSGFGKYQITLLAKKGDPVANALNSEEFEYVSKQGAKFKVLETGFNSMVVEFTP